MSKNIKTKEEHMKNAEPVARKIHPLTAAAGEWLGRYSWDLYGTFTFRFDTSTHRAKSLFESFFLNLKPDIRYFAGIEWHRYRYSTHIHAIVGGTQCLSEKHL
jgi:hypothetical protein